MGFAKAIVGAGIRCAAWPVFGLLALCSTSLQAAVIDVQVSDRDGNPVADVAVYVMPKEGEVRRASTGTYAVMDQIDVRFVPHLLIVQAGTSVRFPNTDTIAHHVYSFSSPNQFKLPIYKGDAHSPVRFEQSGIAILGCNLHDNMVGYILIVDTDVFRKTNDVGRVTLPMQDDGEFEVLIWSPRLRESAMAMTQSVVISGSEHQFVHFNLKKKMRAPHDDSSEAIAWSEY